ncbi:MAG: hypothetical protein Q4D41_04495 [Prevotellaceae bacterium]|nr:hypothetical protein [Prevotellaceae bacterium]
MNYEREILYILNEAGQKGLSVKKIAMHVYNRANGLFNCVELADVRREVNNFILRCSRQPDPIIEKTDTRGVYRISLTSGESRQLQFDFKDYDEDNDDGKDSHAEHEDTSLSLF